MKVSCLMSYVDAGSPIGSRAQFVSNNIHDIANRSGKVSCLMSDVDAGSRAQIVFH